MNFSIIALRTRTNTELRIINISSRHSQLIEVFEKTLLTIGKEHDSFVFLSSFSVDHDASLKFIHICIKVKSDVRMIAKLAAFDVALPGAGGIVVVAVDDEPGGAGVVS